MSTRSKSKQSGAEELDQNLNPSGNQPAQIDTNSPSTVDPAQLGLAAISTIVQNHVAANENTDNLLITFDPDDLTSIFKTSGDKATDFGILETRFYKLCDITSSAEVHLLQPLAQNITRSRLEKMASTGLDIFAQPLDHIDIKFLARCENRMQQTLQSVFSQIDTAKLDLQNKSTTSL